MRQTSHVRAAHRRSGYFLRLPIPVCASGTGNSSWKVNCAMNKCRIHRPFLRRVHELIGDKNPKDTKLNRRALLFIQKWELSKQGAKVIHAGLQVIPQEDTEAILKQEAMTGGMPLSRDGAFAYLRRKYIGFKQNKILSWLKRVLWTPTPPFCRMVVDLSCIRDLLVR